MKLYKLPVTLYEPSEDTNDLYLAEMPLLPGCRAWGQTPSEALEYVQGVAVAFIESYRDWGDPLPPGVEAAVVEVVGDKQLGEILVVV